LGLKNLDFRAYFAEMLYFLWGADRGFQGEERVYIGEDIGFTKKGTDFFLIIIGGVGVALTLHFGHPNLQKSWQYAVRQGGHTSLEFFCALCLSQ